MSRLLETLAVGVLLTVAPVTAWAEPYPECTSEPSDEEVEAAKGAFMAGKAAFDEADYERAITYWSDAYRRDCTAHDLLRNLSRAYELSGQKKAAIDALQTYLDRVPDTPKREQFLVRIEKLQEQVKAEEARESQPAPPERPIGKATPSPPPPPPETPKETETRKPVAPLILAGGGVVVGVVGVVGLVISGNKLGNMEEQCGSNRRDCPSSDVVDDANSWRSRKALFGAIGGAGAGIAAGGVIWYLAAPRKERTGRAPIVEPVIASGFTGVSLRGRF